MIPEVSEPSTPCEEILFIDPDSTSTQTRLQSQSPRIEDSPNDTEDEETLRRSGIYPVIVRKGIISQPHERTSLLSKQAPYNTKRTGKYGSAPDLEDQQSAWASFGKGVKKFYTRTKRQAIYAAKISQNPQRWDGQQLYQQTIKRPASYIPPVILGLLLNILDALSYGMLKWLPAPLQTMLTLSGMILFPLGEPMFANLGPDGISMFYVSCIVSQLVYSLGGSVFKGGIGSEMVSCHPSLDAKIC